MPSRFRDPSHVLRLAVHTEKGARLGVADVSELCSDDHLVAFSFDGAANQLLIRVRTIHVRSVEQVDAQLDGAMDSGDGLLLIAWTVEVGHTHAAESNGGRLEALRAESTGFESGGHSGRCHTNFLERGILLKDLPQQIRRNLRDSLTISTQRVVACTL